jgi:hypothetical protein
MEKPQVLSCGLSASPIGESMLLFYNIRQTFALAFTFFTFAVS